MPKAIRDQAHALTPKEQAAGAWWRSALGQKRPTAAGRLLPVEPQEQTSARTGWNVRNGPTAAQMRYYRLVESDPAPAKWHSLKPYSFSTQIALFRRSLCFCAKSLDHASISLS